MSEALNIREGEVFFSEESGIYTACIDTDGHGAFIEIHRKSKVEAERVRDTIIAALAPAEPGEDAKLAAQFPLTGKAYPGAPDDNPGPTAAMVGSMVGPVKKAVIGQYKVSASGDREGTVITTGNWPEIVKEAGLTGQWMELAFYPVGSLAGADWSMLEATRDSLREHATMIRERDSAIADLERQLSEAREEVKQAGAKALREFSKLMRDVAQRNKNLSTAGGVEFAADEAELAARLQEEG